MLPGRKALQQSAEQRREKTVKDQRQRDEWEAQNMGGYCLVVNENLSSSLQVYKEHAQHLFNLSTGGSTL